jgi:hypothetical protein
MLYFDNDEERLVRVERLFEDTVRKPAAPKRATNVLVATLLAAPPSPMIAKAGSS